MATSSGSSSWTLSGDSLAVDVELQYAALAIVNDTTLTDDDLLTRAQKHLGVLSRPEFAAYNCPKWIRKVFAVNSTPDRAREITARRLFDAMIQTADEFNLGIGRRFPAAEICACAQFLEYNGTVPTRRLAEKLSTLIFDVWWTSLCWPLSDIGGSPTMITTREFSQTTVQEVLLRDNNTSLVTGSVHKKPGCLERLGLVHRATDRLTIGPIFVRPLTDPEQRSNFRPSHYSRDSDVAKGYRSLHLYRTFGQLKFETTVPAIDVPQNCLLLERRKAYLSFRMGKWSFVPTEEPNRYNIRTYVPPDRCFGTEYKADESITFSAPFSGPGPTVSSETLPNPDVLRAHAIFANILHLSGLGSIFYPDRWETDVTFEIINLKARALLLPYVPGVKPAPEAKVLRTWRKKK
ncbi:hypothetical protein K466DRAFT_655924 [Polyporus arcularius HHB13444]|uniref:HNH nuclease domain-containing protein n=1 Tax=Polyporus arcularius HHB13444 TaxID=1314778 RepID=A0A5C3NXH2_9APHY|nr:hypothetical protein K466DRAFT_655924 [Polyporus arcularius HHB13444]